MGETVGKNGKKWPKKVTIFFKTCFWRGNSWKSKNLRALCLVLLSKVATGDHFQNSKFRIWLKHPGLFLVSFYAAGPLNKSPSYFLTLTKLRLRGRFIQICLAFSENLDLNTRPNKNFILQCNLGQKSSSKRFVHNSMRL